MLHKRVVAVASSGCQPSPTQKQLKRPLATCLIQNRESEVSALLQTHIQFCFPGALPGSLFFLGPVMVPPPPMSSVALHHLESHGRSGWTSRPPTLSLTSFRVNTTCVSHLLGCLPNPVRLPGAVGSLVQVFTASLDEPVFQEPGLSSKDPLQGPERLVAEMQNHFCFPKIHD